MTLLPHSAGQELLATSLFCFATENVCRAEGSGTALARAVIGRAIPGGFFAAGSPLDLLQSVVLICVLAFTVILLVSLAARMLNLTILARGLMRFKFVAATAVRASFICSVGLGAAAFLSAILCAVEVSELTAYASVRAWSAHALPLLFALLLIVAAGFSLAEKEAQTRFQIVLAERSYRVLFEGSLAGAYKTTLDGRLLDCNFSFCQVLGYGSRAEILSKPAGFGYFNEEDRERFNAWLLAERHLENFEQCLRRKDGGSAWVLNTATLAQGQAGAELVIKGTVLDITDLRMELPAWLRRVGNILASLRWRSKVT